MKFTDKILECTDNFEVFYGWCKGIGNQKMTDSQKSLYLTLLKGFEVKIRELQIEVGKTNIPIDFDNIEIPENNS